MQRVEQSPIRKFAMWWMRRGTRYVSSSVAVDFHAASLYLDRLRDEQGPRVTVQNLVCGAVSRLYTEYPVANRRILGRQIYQAPSVGIAMPVNLVGHAGQAHTGETSLMVVEQVEKLSLRDIASATRRSVDRERQGDLSHPVARGAMRVLRHLPGPAFRMGLRSVAGVLEAPGMARLGWKVVPMTTAVTNVGATTRAVPGALFRGAAYELPDRLVHTGSLWGVGPVQDEVIPVEGRPMVRPVLPIVLVFDHRLFDGVIASQLLTRFAAILQDPEAVFGPQGRG